MGLTNAEHLLERNTYNTWQWTNSRRQQWERGAVNLPVEIPLDKVWYAPGGWDIHPSIYGDINRGSYLNPTWPELTLYEAKLIRYLVDMGVPLLGICRGHQLIHAATGGFMAQEVSCMPRKTPGLLHYRLTELPLEDGAILGLLRNILGPGIDYVALNHTHHQAVVAVGNGFKAVATDDNTGIVEAAEHIQKPILTFQFHPEYDNHPWSAWFIQLILDYLSLFVYEEVKK